MSIFTIASTHETHATMVWISVVDGLRVHITKGKDAGGGAPEQFQGTNKTTDQRRVEWFCYIQIIYNFWVTLTKSKTGASEWTRVDIGQCHWRDSMKRRISVYSYIWWDENFGHCTNRVIIWYRVVFSCPGQLNSWLCHWVSQWVSESVRLLISTSLENTSWH